MHQQANYPHSHRRGLRIALFLTALAFFAITTAGLHSLSDHYGWRHGHWGAHHSMGDHFHGRSDTTSNATQQPSTPKQPS